MREHKINYWLTAMGLTLFCSCLGGGCRGGVNNPAVSVSVPTPEMSELQLAMMLYDNVDCVKAFEIFRKYAEEGNVEAEAWLGRCYMNGIGTALNPELAYHCFKRAADQNNPWGLNGLGVCCQYGYGTAIDLQRAKDLFSKAAEMGNPFATLNLARVYAEKENGFFDPELAEKYYKKAMELEAPGSRFSYASFLFFQECYEEAVPLLQASQEESLSVLLLARCYENGWGVPVDISRAVELAEEHFSRFGSHSESAEICFNAGLEEMLINGMTEFAKRCFKNAAEQNHLGGMYHYALNLLNDSHSEDALKFMRRAADGGDGFAMLETGKLLADRKDFAQAIRYFSQAVLEPRVQLAAVEHLSSLYHYQLRESKNGLFWDQKGMELGSDFCRNEIAWNWILQNDTAHFSEAVALLAEGCLNGNEFATQRLEQVLTHEYERLRQLADDGDSAAQLSLGIVGIRDGKGHPNVPVGIELLEKSAAGNNAQACLLLGNLYAQGELVEQDLKKAFFWYQKGAELGNVQSARQVTFALTNWNEFEGSDLAVFQKAFGRCLELEDFSVAFDYGTVIEFMTRDTKNAEEMYRLAASHNDSRAMVQLHRQLFNSNLNESVSFLQHAVALQDPEAEILYGFLLTVWKQPRNAFISFLNAFRHGNNTHAAREIADCYRKSYGCEFDLYRFKLFAEIAFEHGDPEVCALLGSVYREGKILAKDLEKAEKYFKIGVERGNEACRKALDEMGNWKKTER